jgi:hypothetical protein
VEDNFSNTFVATNAGELDGGDGLAVWACGGAALCMEIGLADAGVENLDEDF